MGWQLGRCQVGAQRIGQAPGLQSRRFTALHHMYRQLHLSLVLPLYGRAGSVDLLGCQVKSSTVSMKRGP